jgi:hypothetical protein
MNSTAEIGAVLKILSTTPRRIATLANGQKMARLHLRPAADTWSANDVLAHLRACSDVWGKDIMKILAEDRPTLRYLSPRTWIGKTNYPDLTFETSMGAFARQRKELLKTLKGLSSEGWTRAASFKMGKKTREMTVFECASRMAEHESKHCEQIRRVLGG